MKNLVIYLLALLLLASVALNFIWGRDIYIHDNNGTITQMNCN